MSEQEYCLFSPQYHHYNLDKPPAKILQLQSLERKSQNSNSKYQCFSKSLCAHFLWATLRWEQVRSLKTQEWPPEITECMRSRSLLEGIWRLLCKNSILTKRQSVTPLQLIPFLILKGQKFHQVLPPWLRDFLRKPPELPRMWSHTVSKPKANRTYEMQFYEGRLTSNLPRREEHLKYKYYDRFF